MATLLMEKVIDTNQTLGQVLLANLNLFKCMHLSTYIRLGIFFSENGENYLSENTNYNEFILLSELIVVCIFLIVLTQKILPWISRSWDTLSKEIFSQLTISNDDFNIASGDSSNLIEITLKSKTTFQDVAGNVDAKKELNEVIKFLKNPESFYKLGASIPKGVLLEGAPGTGKTLLAKAVAGEAGVPFLKVSGSQFVELLVGIGAARARELFKRARALKPAVIFIDEIDSIARTRAPAGNGSSAGASMDEREQTLNQILTEMDGFGTKSGVVVIATTNRVDILDPAIRRAGRFDRQISISVPTLKDRVAILRVHARNKRIDSSVSLDQIAYQTAGFSGADLANALNEAALLAGRQRKSFISSKEINRGIEKIAAGLGGRQANRAKFRLLIGLHEIGQGLTANLSNSNPGFEKLTLVPQGQTQRVRPSSLSGNLYSSRNLLIAQALSALGGRAAEEVVGGPSESTIVAQQSLVQVTRLIRVLVLKYAMARLQQLKQGTQTKNLFFIGSDARTETTNLVDNFTTSFIDITYSNIQCFLELSMPGQERLVDELLSLEELSGKDLRTLAQEYLSSCFLSERLAGSRQSSFFGIGTSRFFKNYSATIFK